MECEFIKLCCSTITECHIRVANCSIRVFRSLTKAFCISKIISNLNYNNNYQSMRGSGMQAGDGKQGTNKWPCLDLFKNFVRIGI